MAVGLIVGVVGVVLLAAGGDSENAHADRATTLGVIVLLVAALSVARGAWIALRR
jgi:drug/metabolite transporter (DMT)-like permease